MDHTTSVKSSATNDNIKVVGTSTNPSGSIHLNAQLLSEAPVETEQETTGNETKLTPLTWRDPKLSDKDTKKTYFEALRDGPVQAKSRSALLRQLFSDISHLDDKIPDPSAFLCSQLSFDDRLSIPMNHLYSRVERSSSAVFGDLRRNASISQSGLYGKETPIKGHIKVDIHEDILYSHIIQGILSLKSGSGSKYDSALFGIGRSKIRKDFDQSQISGNWDGFVDDHSVTLKLTTHNLFDPSKDKRTTTVIFYDDEHVEMIPHGGEKFKIREAGCLPLGWKPPIEAQTG